MDNLISKENAVKSLKMFRRCLIGARRILEDDGSTVESEQLKSFAVINAVESLALVDLYITGYTLSRGRTDNVGLAELLTNGGQLTIVLSDDAKSKMTVLANHPYIRFEAMEAQNMDVWNRWRKINVAASFPTEDMIPDDEEAQELLQQV